MAQQMCIRDSYQPLNALGRGDEGLGAVQVDLAVATLVVGGQARNVRTRFLTFTSAPRSSSMRTAFSSANAQAICKGVSFFRMLFLLSSGISL